jgi:hypothetical protein
MNYLLHTFNPFRNTICNALGMQSAKINISDAQVGVISRSEITTCINILNKSNEPVIIGGSYALSQFVTMNNLNCNYDDIDIIMSNTDTELFQFANNVAPQYKSVYICKNDNKNKYNINGQIIGVKDINIDVEEFDKKIIGTVNCVSNDGEKHQYVFVNESPENLCSWYAKTSDLPVFITKTGNNYVFELKSISAANDALSGVLSGVKHKYRIEKYQNKGFIVNSW